MRPLISDRRPGEKTNLLTIVLSVMKISETVAPVDTDPCARVIFDGKKTIKRSEGRLTIDIP